MQLANLNINFKPEFGNPQHIKICELISLVNTDYANIEKKKVEARGAEALKKKIGENMSKVQRLLEQQKKNGV